MEERTFKLKTRAGEVYEIENAISQDEIERTREKITRLKRAGRGCILAITISAISFASEVGYYLKKCLYDSDTTKENSHIHMSALLTQGQLTVFIVSVLVCVALIAALCFLFLHEKEKLRKYQRKYSEQSMRSSILDKMRSADEKDLAIEFGRTAFGDTMITVVVCNEAFILSENIHRMPIEKDASKRLRFMTNEIYYLNATKDRTQRIAADKMA